MHTLKNREQIKRETSKISANNTQKDRNVDKTDPIISISINLSGITLFIMLVHSSKSNDIISLLTEIT